MPPFIITLRKKIINTQIHSELTRTEYIIYSNTGYTNNKIVIEYLNYFIKYSYSGPTKKQRVLLLDRHELSS